MHSRCETSTNILRDRDILDFGRLLDQAWQEKRKLSDKVSNPQVDTLYQEALDAGAIGGKPGSPRPVGVTLVALRGTVTGGA